MPESDYPNDRDRGRGVEYFFQIQNEIDWPGVICQLGYDKPFYRYGTRPKRSPHSPLNRLTGKPPLIFLDLDGNERYRIPRAARFPPTFQLLESGEGEERRAASTIKLVSFLRNKYTIQLDDGVIWTFLMPLFRIHFHGHSTAGHRVWVRVWKSKRQWLVLREPEANQSLPTAGALFYSPRVVVFRLISRGEEIAFHER